MAQEEGGHVYGASAALEHWFMRKFKDVAIAGGSPLSGSQYVLCFPYDEYFNPDFHTYQPLKFELVERKGQVALWRWLQADCYAVQPNPIAVLGLCGAYDVNLFTSATGFPYPYGHFGCGPLCAVQLDFTPDMPTNLMMLTVSLARPAAEMEDYGWEYAVVVQEAADGSTLAAQWDAVLGLHMPSTVAFGLDCVSAIDTGNLYPTPTTDPLKGRKPL